MVSASAAVAAELGQAGVRAGRQLAPPLLQAPATLLVAASVQAAAVAAEEGLVDEVPDTIVQGTSKRWQAWGLATTTCSRC